MDNPLLIQEILKNDKSNKKRHLYEVFKKKIR
jgi:hypothetical protein